MKTLSASTAISRIVVDRTSDVRFLSPVLTDDRRSRTGACFLRFQKCPHFIFIHSSPEMNRVIDPVTALSSQATEIQTAESHDQEKHHSTVRVKFQLRRECLFGEQFLLVGDDPLIGLWDPSNAVPLNWTDGHLWVVELDIPVARSIQFKFILQRQKGDVLWQPGPDRVFQAWETENSIVVCEDWDNAESQKIIEEQIPIHNASITSKDSKVLVPNMDPDGTSSLARESGSHVDTISYSDKSSTAYQDLKTNSKMKSFSNKYEAVLIPGLTQSKVTENEAGVDEGGSEAQDHDIPEMDSNQDPTSEGNTGIYSADDNLVNREVKEKFATVKINEAILKNDRQWGLKTLQAFLNTLRTLWHQT